MSPEPAEAVLQVECSQHPCFCCDAYGSTRNSPFVSIIRILMSSVIREYLVFKCVILFEIVIYSGLYVLQIVLWVHLICSL